MLIVKFREQSARAQVRQYGSRIAPVRAAAAVVQTGADEKVAPAAEAA